MLEIRNNSDNSGNTCADSLTILGETDTAGLDPCNTHGDWDPAQQASQTGIEVRWSNLTTNVEGAASQGIYCEMSGGEFGLPLTFYSAHEWKAVVPLAPGQNSVVVTATYVADATHQSKLRHSIVSSPCAAGERCEESTQHCWDPCGSVTCERPRTQVCDTSAKAIVTQSSSGSCSDGACVWEPDTVWPCPSSLEYCVDDAVNGPLCCVYVMGGGLCEAPPATP